MDQSAKPVIWIESSLNDVRRFPPDARQRAGRELCRVQLGNLPVDWKPMKTIGPGVAEIRVHGQAEHRLIYVAKFQEAVYVLHAFEKRSQKTSRRDLDIAIRRYKNLLKARAQA